MRGADYPEAMEHDAPDSVIARYAWDSFRLWEVRAAYPSHDRDEIAASIESVSHDVGWTAEQLAHMTEGIGLLVPARRAAEALATVEPGAEPR
jgi:hypothetical protein